MTDNQLATAVERTTIFARVDPEQKLRVIKAMQKNKHVVGYMGDGVNDASSARAADVEYLLIMLLTSQRFRRLNIAKKSYMSWLVVLGRPPNFC